MVGVRSVVGGGWLVERVACADACADVAVTVEVEMVDSCEWRGCWCRLFWWKSRRFHGRHEPRLQVFIDGPSMEGDDVERE